MGDIKLMRHLKGQPEPPKRKAPKGTGPKKTVVKIDPNVVRPEFMRLSVGDWLNVAAISQMIPVYSVRMIKYYAKQNRMPFPMVKISNTWYARKDEVEKYLKSLYDAATTRPNTESESAT